MSRIEVLIHTRTNECDFPSSQFAISPSVIDSSSMEKIRTQIKASTFSIDSLNENEVRHLIYSCGNYIIAGMVSFLKNFADSNTDDERFFYDIKGRKTFAFVGLVIEIDKSNQQIPIINKNILWKIFKTNISDIWERKVIEFRRGITAELDFEKEEPLKPSAKAEKISGVTMYVSGADDSPIFSYWLSRALKGDTVSFCSNITDSDLVKNKQFSVITTTTNIIQRMRMEEASSAQNQDPSPLSPRYDFMPEKKTQNSTDKPNLNKTLNSTLIVIIAVLLFVILIVTVLIIKLLASPSEIKNLDQPQQIQQTHQPQQIQQTHQPQQIQQTHQQK